MGVHLDKSEWERKIRRVEKTHKFREGHKLLYCPWETIQSAKIAFISLNPGRPPDDADLRVISDERGNSYEVEEYETKSPLTDQFLQLCRFMKVQPGSVEGTV